jgi:hypothetical protein
VGPDSLVDGRRYTIADAAPIAQLPEWIADILAARIAAAAVKAGQGS